MGKVLVVLGLLVVAVGALIMLGFPVGRLPGDIVYRRGNITFYVPVMTSLLASVVLTLILTFFRR
jgi:di/tricarboxylate transporter